MRLRVIGVVVMAIGTIHVISAIAIYGPQLWALAQGGFGGLYDAPADGNAGFWSVLFGVLAVAAGQQLYWSATRFGAVSTGSGWFLLAVGSVGAWVVPIAPFWIAAAAGLAILVLAWRSRHTASPPT